ncbi:O-antigen ligase family protein [Pseudomonas oryzihabitans]|uniref:O-antigen ligase family protein n=1 Tax=Pseudomonas oryzihabitans TaxID=47885 RepID=UPI003F59D663
MGLLALVPFEDLVSEGAVSAPKLIGGAMLAVLALRLVVRQTPLRDLRSNLWRLLVLFLICTALSLIYSERPDASVGNLRELFIGMALFPITLLALRDFDLFWLCRLVVLGVATTCLLSLLTKGHEVGGRAIGLLSDANYFALLIAVALPLAILLLLHERQPVLRLLWILCLVLLGIGLVKTDSRSGLIVAVATLLIGLWHHRPRLRRVRPRHLGFILLGAALALTTAVTVLPDAYLERIASLSSLGEGINPQEDPSLGRRASYVVVGEAMIAAKPWFGTGPGTFPYHYAQTGYASAYSMGLKVPDLYRRAHNTYLELFSEFGVPAGLLFVGLIGKALYNCYRAGALRGRQGQGRQADLAVHLGLSLLAVALFMAFLSIPNHKYFWALLALSSILRDSATRAPAATGASA